MIQRKDWLSLIKSLSLSALNYRKRKRYSRANLVAVIVVKVAVIWTLLDSRIALPHDKVSVLTRLSNRLWH